MVKNNSCMSCDTIIGKRKPPGGVVYENEYWMVFLRSKSIMTPGYTFIILKRHCEDLSELTSEELATLGPIMKNTSLALCRVLKPVKVYISLYGEGVKHIHFHVFPRTPDMPAGNLAVTILTIWNMFLHRLGLKRAYSDEEVGKVASQMRAEFQRMM